MKTQRTALVTGATGYVGGLVVKQLLRDDWRVKVLARNEDKALDRTWGDEVIIVEGDAKSRDNLAEALRDADCAWYLLHSMDDGAGFAEEEADMARKFGEEAKRAGVQRIVYLGGLHPSSGDVSEHLASRVRVGEILLESGVPAAVLQAGVVIGDGSLSFQLLRHVTERVPAFIAPGWITNEITPISARDIAHYLVRAADLPADVNRAFDVGGPDSMPYVDMMERYAVAVGLHRRPYVTAPIFTRKLAAWGLGILTPLSYKQILPIFESVSVDTVVKERDLEAIVGPPEGGNQKFEDAVRAAAQGTNPGWYGGLATPLHLGAVAAGIYSGRPLKQVPINLAAAVAGTVLAGNAKEKGRSPWPAVAASALAVATTSRRR